MQIETETELITFEGWTLRVRPSQPPKRLLLLIHGLTGDENSMWVFARGLSPDYWIIAPRAPYETDLGGYSWRLAQPETLRRAPPAESPQSSASGMPGLEMLKPASERLLALVDAYSSSVPIDAREFDLMGFSQGAAMVNIIGMLHPQRVRKMGVLAGFVPSGMEQSIAQRPLEGKQVFVAHGTQDIMVSLDRARASIELLERAGAKVTYCEDDVGHKLSPSCLRALEAFMTPS